MIKIILIALLTLFLTNCAQKSYEVKQEAKIEELQKAKNDMEVALEVNKKENKSYKS